LSWSKNDDEVKIIGDWGMGNNKKYPSKSDVKHRVITAICNLFKCDKELLAIDVNERSITHKLAEYLQQQFPYWHVDCEYNRREFDVKRLNLRFESVGPEVTEAVTIFPDIIIHRRLSKQNLVVIEVKKASGNIETMDIEKIKAFTKDSEFKYIYGIFLKIDENITETKLVLYRDGKEQEDWTNDIKNALRKIGYGE